MVLVPQLGWKENKWLVLAELIGRGVCMLQSKRAGSYKMVEGTLREYIIVYEPALLDY